MSNQNDQSSSKKTTAQSKKKPETKPEQNELNLDASANIPEGIPAGEKGEEIKKEFQNVNDLSGEPNPEVISDDVIPEQGHEESGQFPNMSNIDVSDFADISEEMKEKKLTKKQRKVLDERNKRKEERLKNGVPSKSLLVEDERKKYQRRILELENEVAALKTKLGKK